MKACSRNRKKRWSAAEAAACILLVMTFGHLLNTVMNVTGFTRIFSGYQDMASKIYEGQNPLLLILSVGVLSAAAEEIVFRGMIYRRAKDFWGTGWGIAASCLLFGAYHGNVTQFVYAAVVSVLLILIYERCGTLLAPVLAHMAENIWGLYRSQFVSWMTQKAPAGAWMFIFLEAVICAGTFWYLFLKDKQGKHKNNRKNRRIREKMLVMKKLCDTILLLHNKHPCGTKDGACFLKNRFQGEKHGEE